MATTPSHRRGLGPTFWTAFAAIVGVALIWAAASTSSATYDESTYLEAGARWWRGTDRVGITRMGSPQLFWKIQQAPVFWAINRLGREDLIDDLPFSLPELLRFSRLGTIWIWLAGLVLVAWWARLLNGPWAMVFAAWWYALSPNLIAHGALVTMETPVTVATTATFMAFWRFLSSRQSRWFWASAILCGLAFSCKFTAIVYPPILGLIWWVDGLAAGEGWRLRIRRTAWVALGMTGYLLALLASDFALTDFATLPLSPTSGTHPSASGWLGPLGPFISQLYETPIPQDWVGFAAQVRHQASGGPGYLLGERRMGGWRHYYLVAIAVKVPLVLWLLAAFRLRVDGGKGCLAREPDRMLLQATLLFFLVASAGSSRNYGVRYLLPVAPLVVVWLSRLAKGVEEDSPERRRGIVVRLAVLAIGLIGQGAAVASVFPDELTYFNAVAGGRIEGRRVLGDSNLDWGQGLKSLAHLQDDNPLLEDLTLYYFGDVDPNVYRVAGAIHVINADEDQPTPPPVEGVKTAYIAVSASLQYGPWGPPGFFQSLDGVKPVAMTRDTTIAVYDTVDIR